MHVQWYPSSTMCSMTSSSNRTHVFSTFKTRPQTTKIYFLGAPSPSAGDVWYLWLLLKMGATPRSFDDIRCIGDRKFSTFKDTAHAKGLLDNPSVNEATFAMTEAIENNATPSKLRRLFVLLVKSEYPVGIAFDKFYTNMLEERWKTPSSSDLTQKIELLTSLDNHLAAEGCKRIHTLGISVPDGYTNDDTELLRTRRTQLVENRERDAATVVSALAIFTEEQKSIFNEVVTACRGTADAMYDIRGRAGCGKTLLINAICAQARLDGHLTAPTAATGLAALNQQFGMTFHRTWGIPVLDPRDDQVLQSNLQSGMRGPVMSNTRLSTIDEISSLHIAAFEAAARALPRSKETARTPSAFNSRHLCTGGCADEGCPIWKRVSSVSPTLLCLTFHVAHRL